jgi:AcrR family transcriptional regulator
MAAEKRPRAPRKDQQRNRSALVSAAREVFAVRGIAAPLDVIARRAGVSGATLYRHFPDRHRLVEAALLVNLHRHEEAIAAAQRCELGWDGLLTYLRWLWNEQLADISYLSALREIGAGDSAEVDRLRQLTTEGFTTLIDRAKAQGDLRADRGIEDVLLYLLLNEQLGSLPKEEARAASRRLFRLAIDSIAANPAPIDPTEPPEVLTLRQTLLRRAAGHPVVA